MTKVYVRKDSLGTILGVSTSPLEGYLAVHDDQEPAIAKFLNDPLGLKNAAPTTEAVGKERDRRLALGFNYDFGDERGVHHFATTEADMRGWDRVTKLKDVMLQGGDTTSTITIATATGITQVTAPEWNEILLYAGMHFEQPLYQASFALQAMNPIPADYATNPAYWPA
ncbi:hypothetical protein [Rhizobium sp. GCM10022189]|uniref:hypothetical protein n=1 Tax=Rhizobium sp. GCM10022189 TaxID=3252654 RepID=UPI00360A8B41